MLGWNEVGGPTPLFSGDKPQFFFLTTDATGGARLPGDIERGVSGDHTPLDVILDNPVTMGDRGRFAIHEGGKMVNPGRVRSQKVVMRPAA